MKHNTNTILLRPIYFARVKIEEAEQRKVKGILKESRKWSYTKYINWVLSLQQGFVELQVS